MRPYRLNISLILVISCFFCIMSQLPDLWGNPTISLIYNIGWIGLFFIFLIKENFKIKIPVIIVLFPLIFDLMVVLLQILTKKNYLNSNMFKPLNLCFFISIIGYYLGKYSNLKIVKKIVNVFLIGTAILGLSIFKNAFSGVDWQNASWYLYTAKNSAAMIFLNAIIMGVLYIKDLKKNIVIPLIIFLSLLILMLKSRATIVCLLFIIMYLILFYIKKPIAKLTLALFFIIVIMYILFNDSAYDLFINKIMLNNRGSTDLRVITSGRDEHFEIFLNLFPIYFLSGTGGTYLESFPLAALLSYGVFVGLFVIFYAFMPGLYVLITMKKNNGIDKRFKYLILALNITMAINGFFEELTPLGPGVKCFALWLLFGIYVGFEKRGLKVERN